jgi:hypothetical protein
MDTINQLKNIKNEISDLGGDEYIKQFDYSINEIQQKNNSEVFHVIIDAMEMLTEDNKTKKINYLKKDNIEIKKQLNELTNENTKLNIRIKSLENDMTELKVNLAQKEEKEYIITLIQASRNMEHYIIKKLTNWTDDEIRNYGGLGKLKKNYSEYKDEIEIMEEEFGLSKNRININKINEKRKLYAHPNPVDEEELEKACNKFCGKYPGLISLYEGYLKYSELVRPVDDE